MTRLRLPRPRAPSAGRILRSPALPWALFGLAALAAVAFALLWRGERAEDARRAEVEATAREFLLALTNFSGETIDRDVEEIQRFAIGRFAEEVRDTFGPEQVEAIRGNDATSTGTIRDLFVQHLGEDTATVFGVVDETVSNASTRPRTEVLRIEVGLIETADEWKVDRVEILQNPAGPPPAP